MDGLCRWLRILVFELQVDEVLLEGPYWCHGHDVSSFNMLVTYFLLKFYSEEEYQHQSQIQLRHSLWV